MSLKNYIYVEKIKKEGKELTPESKFGEELANAILNFLETYKLKTTREKVGNGLMKISNIDFGENKKVIDNLKDNIFFNSNTGKLSLLNKEGYQKLEGLEDADIERAIVDQKQKLLGNGVRQEIFDHLFPNFSKWMKKHTPDRKESRALMRELSQRLEEHADSSSVTGGGGSADSEYASAVVNKGSGHEELKDTDTTPELNSAKENISQWKGGGKVPTIKQDLAILFNEGSLDDIKGALQIDPRNATNKGGILDRLIGNKNYNEIRKDPNLTHFGSAKFLTNLSDVFINGLNQDEKNKVKELAEACKTTAKSGYTRGFFGGKKSYGEIVKLDDLIRKLNNGPGVAPRK